MNPRSGTPRTCPACAAELYPVARLRPQPGLSPLAKLLLAVGALASGAIFVGVAFYYGFVVRQRPRRLGEVRPSGGLVGIVAMFPALVPGLIFAWMAYRLPKSLTLKCPRCTWRGRYRIGRDGYAVSVDPLGMPAPPERRSAVAAQNALFDRIEVAWAPPPPPADASVTSTPQGSSFAVVDDELPATDADGWAYEKIANAWTPEEVAAALVAAGWHPAHADVVAERARKQTRHRRP